MIADRTTLATVAIAAAARLTADGARLFADGAAGVTLPGTETISNMTSTGAVIFLVFWITTRTVPALVSEFREERKLDREEINANREKFRCHANPKE